MGWEEKCDESATTDSEPYLPYEIREYQEMFPRFLSEAAARGIAMRIQQRCFILGALSLLVYVGIAWLSWGFIYGQGHVQRPIVSFVGLYTAAWIFSMLALRNLREMSDRRLAV